MKKNSDIFGIAFKDFLEGQTDGKIIIKTDVSGIEELPVMYFFRGKDELPEWEQIALDICKGRVLDAGAGAGSHALILQEMNFDLVAMDISEGAVEIMKNRGVENAVCSDFHSFNDEKKFDTILFLMNGIGLAKNLEGLKNTLDHCKTLLNKNGQIILESSDLIYLYEDNDGSFYINLSEKYYGEVEYILSYKKNKGEKFNWLYVDYDNLASVAELSGFKSELVYKGDNYNYLAVLRK
ncbi:MAG: class I SAM-dependent methyltransferase [Bacteroidetes bacterium]|nr:class I SAM-dependent methyltransferase [Bacteroidota bacterium]